MRNVLVKNEKALFSLAEVIDFVPHEAQVKVMRAFLNHRFLLLAAGRRFGKSRLVALFALYALMSKDTKVICISKTYKLAKKVFSYVERDAIKFFGVGNVNINKSDMTISLPWGALLELGTADNPDSLLGDNYSVVIVDEAATISEKIWQQHVNPLIRDNKGTVILISTPRGHNWFYRIFAQGQRRESGWWSMKSSSFVNKAIYDDEEVELVKSQVDVMYYNQEYLADFVSFVAQVYPDFDEDRHVVDANDKNVVPDFSSWDMYVTIDPGYAQMCAIQWIAYSKVSGMMYVVDEVLKPRMRYEDIMREIIKREPVDKEGKTIGYAGFVCDVAGNQREQTGRSFINWFEEQDWFMNRNYTIFSKKYGIITGINKVRARLLNVNNEIRLKVLSNCTGTIDMFQNFHYPENKNTEKPDKDGVWDHPADTIRYFVEYIDIQESGSSYQDL